MSITVGKLKCAYTLENSETSAKMLNTFAVNDALHHFLKFRNREE